MTSASCEPQFVLVPGKTRVIVTGPRGSRHHGLYVGKGTLPLTLRVRRGPVSVDWPFEWVEAER